jgi:hypothetical protein
VHTHPAAVYNHPGKILRFNLIRSKCCGIDEDICESEGALREALVNAIVLLAQGGNVLLFQERELYAMTALVNDTPRHLFDLWRVCLF